jgi:hypothetical protein
MPHFMIFVKPTLKNEAFKFLRKDINYNSFITSVDIIVGIILFGSSSFAVFTI